LPSLLLLTRFFDAGRADVQAQGAEFADGRAA